MLVTLDFKSIQNPLQNRFCFCETEAACWEDDCNAGHGNFLPLHVDWLAYRRLWQSQFGKGWMDGWVKKPLLAQNLEEEEKLTFLTYQAKNVNKCNNTIIVFKACFQKTQTFKLDKTIKKAI